MLSGTEDMMIGDHRVVLTKTIIVKHDPATVIKFQARIFDVVIDFTLQFSGNLHPFIESKYKWSIHNTIVNLEFENWNRQSDTVVEPVLLGTIGNQPFGFAASHTLVAARTHVMHLLILEGGTYGKG
jgi:hypothetical protein